jgi:hypothetical protein
MRFLNPRSEERSDVTVIGVSAHRIQVLSPVFVHPGTLIQLRLDEDTFLLGEACCCETVGSTFQIGVDIQDAFEGATSPRCVISPNAKIA